MKPSKPILQNIKAILIRIFIKQIRTTLFVLLIAVLFILALPQFSIKIGDSEIKFPRIDLSLADASSNVGNFRRGYGLYPTNEVKAQVDLSTFENKETKFEEVVTKVQNRAGYAGLFDVEISKVIQDDNYYITFEYPEYYSEVDYLTEWLTKRGEIKFNIDSVDSTILIDSDILGEIGVLYDQTYKHHIRFSVNANKLLELTSALQSAQTGLTITLDGEQVFQVGQPYQADIDNNYLRAIPSDATVALSSFRSTYLQIFKSYFAEPTAMDVSITSTGEVSSVSAEYPLTGSIKLSALIVAIGFLIMIIAAAILLSQEKRLAFILSFGGFIVISFTLLKYLPVVTLSIWTLITFLFLSALVFIGMIRLLDSTETQFIERSRMYIFISITGILLSMVLFQFTPLTNTPTDISGVIGVFSIVFLLFNLTINKYIYKDLVLTK
jgi:hypothetical protein